MFPLILIFILVFVVLFLHAVWRFGTRNFGYWKKKGVKHEEPVFFFGNMYNQFTLRLSFAEQIAKWYEKFPEEQFVGVHMANDVALVLRDPELIKCVFVTDFKYFHQRGFHSHKTVREPLFQNMFTGDGDVWKLSRQRLTPAFSSAKLKAMFPLIEATTAKMLATATPGTHDAKELMARCMTDIIGACGFGLDCDSLNDENSVFRRLGKRLIQRTMRDSVVVLLKRLAPELFKHLYYFAPVLEKYTFQIVKHVLDTRNYMPSGRHDFIDLLLELKQKGKIVGQSIEHFNSDGTPKTAELEMDDQQIMAQVFVFIAAGFETSSSATSFLLHELAFHPEIQKHCHEEIDKVLERHAGKLSYDAVKEMTYLEMALKEVLRLHPSPTYLLRKCAKQYTFPGTNLTIDEDVSILVPIQSLQRDPIYFEDPHTFRPDRFHPDNVGSIPKYVYLPFGTGPRICMGERLGIMQSLAGVAALLSRFRVEPAATTRRKLLINPHSFFVEHIIGGLPLNFVERQPA